MATNFQGPLHFFPTTDREKKKLSKAANSGDLTINLCLILSYGWIFGLSKDVFSQFEIPVLAHLSSASHKLQRPIRKLRQPLWGCIVRKKPGELSNVPQ